MRSNVLEPQFVCRKETFWGGSGGGGEEAWKN